MSDKTAFLVDLTNNKKLPITVPKCRVGRDRLNDIVLDGDQSIARFQFSIRCNGEQYSIEDMDSKKDTFVDGQALLSPLVLKDGAVIKIGHSLFWFALEDSSSAEEQVRQKPQDKINIFQKLNQWLTGKKS